MRYIRQSQSSVKEIPRRAFAKGLAVGLIPLVAFVVLVGGPQYGRAEDALFIDKDGTVKVKRLDVEGTLKTTGTVDAKKYVGDGSDLTLNTEMGEQSLKDAMALIRQALEKMVPIGTIIAYGGDVKSPDVIKELQNQGWLVCDGMQVKRDDYPALFRAVGASFGAGDGKTTFHLPDMRGRFLRGVDVEDPNKANWRDPDHDTRSASASGGNAGNQVGSLQADEIKRHRHVWQGWYNTNYAAIRKSSRPAQSKDWRKGETVAGQDDYGGSESRPKNIYVYWIIKAKHVM